MATEPMTPDPEGDAASLIAQLRREQERLQHSNEQLEEQKRALQVLQEVANTLSAELNLTRLLRRIAIAAVRLTSAGVSVLYLVEADAALLRVKAVETAQTAADSGAFTTWDLASYSQPGWTPDEEATPDGASQGSIAIGEGVAGNAAFTGMRVLVNEPQNDRRFTASDISIDTRILGVQPSALLAVPLIFKGVVSGVLEVAHTDQSAGFDASILDLLTTLAAQAATAVANAQLYQHMRTEHERIILAQEDERKRLGRDLHDGPAQRLAHIVISLDYAADLLAKEPDKLHDELISMRESANTTMREIRNLLFDLRPLVLGAENGGLVVALRHFLDRFTSGTSPRMLLAADYPERLSHTIELTVFSIVQEAVNNTIKHAAATNCWIEIHEFPDKLVTIVRDDGKGFDTQQMRDDYENQGSWGLLNMFERAQLIQAKLNISAKRGQGTIVSLEVPR